MNARLMRSAQGHGRAMLRNLHRVLATIIAFLFISMMRVAYRYRPKTDIVFLKTHKCASSTLMNIFLRYGMKHDLNFVLPKSPLTHYIGHPTPFRRSFIDDITKYNMSFNILTHHSRYDGNEMRKVMPRDTVYVTILRRPDSLFESLYSYCRLANSYKKNLSAFVEDKNLTRALTRKRVVDERLGFNQMSFDLGYTGPLKSNPKLIVNFVNSIDKAFDLVMMTERLDESLILLKHLLCWNTSDVVAFKINARYAEYKEALSPEVKQKLTELNHADVLLYRHFENVFERKVREFGVHRMATEVQELQLARKAYYAKCVKAEVSMEAVSVQLKRKDVIAFKLKNKSEECLHLTMSELDFHELQPRVVLVFGRAFGAAGGPSAWPRANRAWGPLASSGAAAGSSLFLSGPPQRHRGSSGGARQTTGAVTLGLIWTDVVRESLAALRGPWWKRPITARRRRQTRLHCGVEVDIADHSTSSVKVQTAWVLRDPALQLQDRTGAKI
ncbi:galactosylceramide sulfotransferase-like [Ixodes scapularis]